MPSPSEITPAQLSRLIGTPAAPMIIDLRIDEDFEDDPRFIPGAIRHAHTDLQSLLPKIGSKPLAVYCQKGRKISQGAAAVLRAEGFKAETVAGGQFAWRDAGLPMVAASAFPPFDKKEGRTVWVTRHRPKIDRIACPWLIRRFIDPLAQFLFVPPQDVMLVAEKFAATPFDVEDVRFSHRDDHCSFDTFLAEFGLSAPPLDKLADIVRGADTNRHELAPEAAGVLAVSLGLSRMYRDDLEQLEAGLVLYDALYRWARDASDEGHDWPTTSRRS